MLVQLLKKLLAWPEHGAIDFKPNAWPCIVIGHAFIEGRDRAGFYHGTVKFCPRCGWTFGKEIKGDVS